MLGNYAQTSPSTLPLGLHVCQLSISVLVPSPLLNLTRTWCDSVNATVGADSRLVWPETGKQVAHQSVHSRLWAPQVYLGVEYDESSERSTSTLDSNPQSLTFEQHSIVLSSQRKINSTERFVLNSRGSDLVVAWSSAAPSMNITATFRRQSPIYTPPSALMQSGVTSVKRHEAMRPSPTPGASDPAVPRGGLASPWYELALSDAWQLTDPGLHDNVLAISLQGLANREAATLYLTYPTDWAYGYTSNVRDYVAKSRGAQPSALPSLDAALSALAKQHATGGFVLWDPTGGPSARGSLLAALTAAGVEGALVATPAHQPVLERLGLRLVDGGDFTTRFRNMTDAQIHTWQKQAYWGRTSKEKILWLGGECHTQVRPAIADVGVQRGLFFTDLSTRPLPPPVGTTEYNLADSLVAEASKACVASGAPPLTVMGWHSYCKDFEHTFVTLTSRHGARVHGLNTNPNLSFMSQLPLKQGFTFRNRPLLAAPPAPKTDGIGLGAWNKPSRGSLPYAWEVTLPDLEIQPALLEMFYEDATANDTFVACLSGPGYMYPKAAASSGQLPRLLALAGQSMRTLDLHLMVAFDASDAGTGGHTVTGDTTLSAEVIEAYATHLPEAKLVLNGYGPSFSFGLTQRKPRAPGGGPPSNFSTISFDYYLDPARGVASAAADLVSLADLNPQAPYLLAVHVREYSSVGRVAQILDALPSGRFALLPPHEWMGLANSRPTFRPRIR